MEQETRTYSKNAHHMIMSYNNKVYHVDSVNVNLSECKNIHEAIFHAKEVEENDFCDLHFKIPNMLCEILIEYAKLDNPDAILVVNVENDKFSWNMLSENWLKKTLNVENVRQYVT